MSPEIAGHVSVHISKAVECAKSQMQEEASHQGEVAPNLENMFFFSRSETFSWIFTFLPATITILLSSF